MKLWRWMDVMVFLPDEEGFLAFPDAIPAEVKPPEGGPGLNLRAYDPENLDIRSSVLVDAESGVTVGEDVRPEHRASLEQAETTVSVCPFDPSKAPWPYNGEPPAETSGEGGSLMHYARPDPATGIYIKFAVGSGGYHDEEPTRTECDRPGTVTVLHNGKSSASIWVDKTTGALCKFISNAHPDDVAAFDRWLSDVKLCGQEIECQPG
jgi:hypothetical protein